MRVLRNGLMNSPQPTKESPVSNNTNGTKPSPQNKNLFKESGNLLMLKMSIKTKKLRRKKRNKGRNIKHK
jgi:hypothetical protein